MSERVFPGMGWAQFDPSLAPHKTNQPLRTAYISIRKITY